MTVFVKVCGLKTERDIEAAVAAGADAIGFVFADSPRRLTPATAAAVSKHIPASVKRVAVMLHPDNDEWQAVLDNFMPDVLQTDAADFATLEVPDSISRWPVHREGVSIPDSNADTYVFEGAKSGRGQTVNWAAAAEFARFGNMILAGGLSPDNVGEAISVVKPYGVDVSSGVESSAGIKDVTLINEFVSAAKAARIC